jgi:hypothetical protein
MLTSRKVTGSIPDEVIAFFNLHNPSSRAMALRVDPTSDSNEYQGLSHGKERPARKADMLTTICEPIVQKMWAPRRLTTL